MTLHELRVELGRVRAGASVWEERELKKVIRRRERRRRKVVKPNTGRDHWQGRGRRRRRSR